MLVEGEPSTIGLASEDDRLPLVRGDLFASAQRASRDPVREDGDVARKLHELVMRTAAEDSKAILFPLPELGLVRRSGAEQGRRRVEDERRVRREAGEILVAPVAAERVDKPLRGGQDVGDVGWGNRGRPLRRRTAGEPAASRRCPR